MLVILLLLSQLSKVYLSVWYQRYYCFHSLCLHTYTVATLVDTIMLTPSPTVTHSPVMMGGVNVAAAAAIPVVLLLLLVIGVMVAVVSMSYYLCYHKIQGLKLT